MHPLEGGELDVLRTTPGPASTDHLGLVEADDGFPGLCVPYGAAPPRLCWVAREAASYTAQRLVGQAASKGCQTTPAAALSIPLFATCTARNPGGAVESVAD